MGSKNPLNIEIIRLPAEEWPAYRKLRLEALQTEPQAFHSTFSESATRPDSFWRERLEAAAEGEDNWLLFARDSSGKLTGMVGAIIEEPRVASVISVYVTSGARGLGIGRELMNTLLEELNSRGFIKARLQVNTIQKAAFGLYLKCGFQVVEELKFLPGDGRSDDDYIMEKELN
jgi:ribosomal protein S18 acetylase RimI-like enzyme